MSTSGPAPFVTTHRGEALTTLVTTLARVARGFLRPVQFLAFWIGTLLPFTYVPVLASGTFSVRPLGFAALVVVNLAAMVLGHSYKRPA